MAVNKLRFINANAAPPKTLTAWSNVVDVWRKVWTLVSILAGIIIICAVLFYFGTPCGWGIQPTFAVSADVEVASPISFLDCIYFSVVTIATLGYGDYRPESYGRIIAAFEVLAGIVLMGVFVSRLVSRQQDRMARRLVRGQLNAEIQDFREQIASLLQAFREPTPALLKEQASPLLHRTRGLVTSIARYWRHEALEPNLGDILPLRAAGRLLGELIDLLETVAERVHEKSRDDLHLDDLKAVRSVTESTLLVATVLSDRIVDEGLRHSRERVENLVTTLRRQLQLHKMGTSL